MSAVPPPAATPCNDNSMQSNNNATENESENKNEIIEKPNDKFTALWRQFYEHAESSVRSFEDENTDEVSDEERKQIVKILLNFQRMIFALDQEKKTIAVSYGKGGIELILALVGNQTDEEVTIAALKGIKCCVVSNPVGRNRCRRAGVFDYIGSVMEECCKGGKDKVTEEVVTTFAAICMGNDLNALQGSLEYNDMIARIASIYPQTNTQNMSKYLLTLFETIQSESPLPKETSTSKQTEFFTSFAKAEKYQSEAKDALLNKQFGFAEGQYTNAINLLIPEDGFHLPAIKQIIGELYYERAICRYETEYHESALSDVDESLNWSDGAQQRTLRGKVLLGLGRDQEAEQELSKGNMLLGK